ncbi:hypothetical protein F7734_28470 [Scytonema sp. UIC 10036]|uniref:hypothetical protein n=1 Tax=Scytonema sp. UIC 10036 TaxID=2304196 RepID=UPI0012DA13FF|nr:hypothetical protein [Scytonema sp. UIC 10036]MUG96066.1 hypothetical protein [Scytonema sp. UIC 10036]
MRFKEKALHKRAKLERFINGGCQTNEPTVEGVALAFTTFAKVSSVFATKPWLLPVTKAILPSSFICL